MIVHEDISLPNHSRISKAERGVLSMLRIAVGFFSCNVMPVLSS